jgi:Transposase DDE domain/Group II intron, maturase-specific domain
VSFTFLGFTFRPRKAHSKQDQLFTGFLPGASDDALRRMRQAVRRWRLNRQTHVTLADVARLYNPVIQGWWQYYGAFYRTAMLGIFQHIDRALERWARRKYKPFTAARRLAPDGWTRCKPLHHCCFITGAWPDHRLDDGSRMTRECHVRFCERLRGKFLRPTHHFGMKVHVGADVHTGVAHTVSVTPANAADISQLPNLLREDDRIVIGDAGYVNDTYKRAARQAGVVWGVALKARPKRRLGSAQKRRNRKMSSIRSRVEHLFRVIKRQFGYTKTRYRGLAKNAAQVFTLIGLTNLYLKRHALMS